jgi:hypothetical protein
MVEIFILIPVTLVAVGFGFVFHEQAHKFVAIRYGFTQNTDFG